MEVVIYKIFPLYKDNFYWETKITSFSVSRFLLFSETCLGSSSLVSSMFIWSNIWSAKIIGAALSTNSFLPGCMLKWLYIRFLFIQSSVAFLGSVILKKHLPCHSSCGIGHLYAWQVGILINVRVDCEIMKCIQHQQQITNKFTICVTESLVCIKLFTSQNQKLINSFKS